MRMEGQGRENCGVPAEDARLVRGKAAEYKHKLNSSMCKKAKLGAKLGSGSVGINGTL